MHRRSAGQATSQFVGAGMELVLRHDLEHGADLRASSAPISRALNTSSRAFAMPTTRGSVYSAPQSGTRPTFMNGMQRARGDATMKSASSARLKPAP
jgi:hypothetical protein